MILKSFVCSSWEHGLRQVYGKWTRLGNLTLWSLGPQPSNPTRSSASMHIKRLLDPDIIQDAYGSDVRIWIQDDLEWTWHAHRAFRAQRWIKLKLDPVGRSRERCLTWTRYHTNLASPSTTGSYKTWNKEKEDLTFKDCKWVLKLDPFDCSAHMWCWNSLGMYGQNLST